MDLNHDSFPFMKLPYELRLGVYDYLVEGTPRRKFEDDIAEGRPLILTSHILNQVKVFLRSPYSKAFNGLLGTCSEVQDEVVSYLQKLNFERTANVKIYILWLEDLGRLLRDIGHLGRQNIRHLEFEWDNIDRPQPEFPDSHIWRAGDGPAKIFNLLADCGNLTTLIAKFEVYGLLYRNPDFSVREQDITDLRCVPGVSELRNVCVKGEVSLSYGRRFFRTPSPAGFLEWMKDGMTTPPKAASSNGRSAISSETFIVELEE
jgi:hypothetical protein